MRGFFRHTMRVAFYILFAVLGVAIGLGLTASIIMAMVAASGGPEYLNGGNQFALGILMLLIGSVASAIGFGVGLFLAHRFLARILPLPANVLAENP